MLYIPLFHVASIPSGKVTPVTEVPTTIVVNPEASIPEEQFSQALFQSSHFHKNYSMVEGIC